MKFWLYQAGGQGDDAPGISMMGDKSNLSGIRNFLESSPSAGKKEDFITGVIQGMLNRAFNMRNVVKDAKDAVPLRDEYRSYLSGIKGIPRMDIAQEEELFSAEYIIHDLGKYQLEVIDRLSPNR